MLARRLARRGVAISSALLATLLSRQGAGAPVCRRLLDTTVQAADAMNAGRATACSLISPNVASLTQGVLKAMWIAKLKVIIAVVAAVAFFGGVVGVMYPVLAGESGAQSPPALSAGQAKQEKKPQGPTVHGVVRSLDAGQNTLTIDVTEIVNGKKQSDQRVFQLTKDAKVTLDDRLSKDQPAVEGKLADLTPGTAVVLQLSEDKKSVTAITARGPSLYGYVKSIDPARNSLTFSRKQSGAIEDKTVELAKDAKVLLNDRLKKGDKDQESKLGDLMEGTPVLVQLSVDQKSTLGVRVQGMSVNGTVKGVDIGSNTITVTVKEDEQIVDKTFNMVNDIQVDGKALSELTAGTRVVLRLSVFDKAKTVAIHVPKEGGEQEEN
jgi:hypothetical protein